MSNIFKRTTGGGGSGIITIDGDTGSVTGSTITITGGSTGFTFSGSGTTLTMEGAATYYSLTPYIVGPDVNSQYTTIGAAISAAITAGVSSTSPANIYVKPQSGGYTENLVLVDGINLIGFNQATFINGKISMATAGTATISGLTLKTNGDYVVQLTGANVTNVNLFNCFLLGSDANLINITGANCVLNAIRTDGDCTTNTYFIATAGAINGNYCNFLSLTNTSTQSTIANCDLSLLYSSCEAPILTTGTASISLDYSRIFNSSSIPLIHNGTGDSFGLHSRFETDTASAVSIGVGSTLTLLNSAINSHNVNAITGAGTLLYSFLSFYGTSSSVNVATATSYPTLI